MHQAIGILGGTFDPIHIGHLRMGLEVGTALNLSKVYFIPCFQPVHRESPIATPEQRLAMVQQALSKEALFYADAREIKRQKPSYTIETLEELRQELPNTALCLLVGFDAFLGFPTWHRFNEILNMAHIVVVHRPAFHLPQSGLIADIFNQYLQREITYIHQKLAGGLFLLPMTALDISASEIRKQIAMGGNPRYLLPENVYDYIQQHGIYKK